MTDIDEALRDVWHRMSDAGLRVHAAAVAYQVAVMKAERRSADEILAYPPHEYLRLNRAALAEVVQVAVDALSGEAS